MPMAIVFVLCAAMLWGTTGTAQAFLTGAHPLVVGAARLLLGGISLLMFAILTGKSLNIKGWPKWPFFVSVAAMAAYQPFFYGCVNDWRCGGNGYRHWERTNSSRFAGMGFF
jgi:DME family drug/metabolite transporter